MTWQSDMVAQAAEHVDTFGRACTYRVVVPSTFDVTTGRRSKVTTDSSITAVRTMVRAELAFPGQANHQQQAARFSVTKAALDALSITPARSDVIICGGQEWAIQTIDSAMDGALFNFVCMRSA